MARLPGSARPTPDTCRSTRPRRRAGARPRSRSPRSRPTGPAPPGRRDTAEAQVPGPLGHRRTLAGIQQRLDIGPRTQVTLRDHLRLAVHPRHLAQVPVRLPADHLLVQTRHTLGHTRSAPKSPLATPRNRRSTHTSRSRSHLRIEIARKVPLVVVLGVEHALVHRRGYYPG